MHAIAFNLIISELKKHYKDPYSSAYAEIKKVLEENSFCWIQGSAYTIEGDLRTLFRAIQSLKKLSWFCLSVKDIYTLKIEDCSDFTGEPKENTDS